MVSVRVQKKRTAQAKPTARSPRRKPEKSEAAVRVMAAPVEDDADSDADNEEAKENSDSGASGDNEEEEEEEENNPTEEGTESDRKEEEDVGEHFASTLMSLVGATAAEPEVDVLSKRKKTPMMKEIESEQRRRKRAREASEARRQVSRVGLQLPSIGTKELERDLRKIATRGVITLFNAIRTHQYQQEQAAEAGAVSRRPQDKTEERAKQNEAFMSLLKAQGSSADNGAAKRAEGRSDKAASADGNAGGGGGGWDVLRDDYMLGARLRDFEDEDE